MIATSNEFNANGCFLWTGGSDPTRDYATMWGTSKKTSGNIKYFSLVCKRDAGVFKKTFT